MGIYGLAKYRHSLVAYTIILSSLAKNTQTRRIQSL